MAYEALLDSAYAETAAVTLETPDARTGFLLDAARALEAAMARFTPPQSVRYNTAALPAPGGHVYVYMLPSQPETDVYYVGADVRYTYSPAAGRIVEEKRLHTALLTMDLRGHPEALTQSSAVLTDVPTETDVFYSISRPPVPTPPGESPPIHHYVVTSTHIFLLSSDGIEAGWTHEAWRRAMALRNSGAPAEPSDASGPAPPSAP